MTQEFRQGSEVLVQVDAVRSMLSGMFRASFQRQTHGGVSSEI